MASEQEGHACCHTVDSVSVVMFEYSAFTTKCSTEEISYEILIY